jgi:signal transduction histidine kinase
MPGGGTLRIGVHRAGPGLLAIEVADQGQGIPLHLRERIFEPFFQAEPAATRRAGGLGVGLHLTRALCDAMGATVSLVASSGSGNRFRVSFRITGSGTTI